MQENILQYKKLTATFIIHLVPWEIKFISLTSIYIVKPYNK